MPFALREHPESLAPDDLDDYWSRGWFRMRQALFTTHFLEFEGRFYSAVWLRHDLQHWDDRRAFDALERRNRRFRTTFAPASIVPPSELEDLFSRYRESLTIDVAPSLADLLMGYESSTVFDSWEIRVHDGARLVAAGYFDRGAGAAAGITAFYDPEYRKYSLGKYIIYKKMEFCRDQGHRWFYPGYFVPGRPRFDYKLDLAPGCLEFLRLADGTWQPWNAAMPRPDPLALMERKLGEVGRPLWYNQHLAIHLSPQIQGVELFDFPVFLSLFWPGKGPAVFIVYDPRDGLYHLLHLRTVYQIEVAEPRPGIWESDLFQVERLLFSTAEASEMVAAAQLLTA